MIQIVGCNSVGNGISCHRLRIGLRKRNHLFGINFYRFIIQLGTGDSFQALRSLRQIGVSLHPCETVDVDSKPAGVNVLV